MREAELGSITENGVSSPFGAGRKARSPLDCQNTGSTLRFYYDGIPRTMLEIVILFFLCKAMGKKLRAKGWEKPIWMQVAVVLGWFTCMFIGSFIYGIALAIKSGGTATEPGFAVYPIAFISGAIGAGIVFLIATLLPSKLEPPVQPGVNRF